MLLCYGITLITLGKHKPQGYSVLMFDEVKVVCQLIWNSGNQKLSGLAMTSYDMSSLNDIYRILKEPDSPTILLGCTLHLQI